MILWWFLPYIDMNQQRMYMCPHVYTFPLCTLALSALFHASNLDWSSISYMVIYMFHAILSNHPTLTFSHRVQKSVFYICVFCCLTYRITVTIFLNSVYMCQYSVLVIFFLTYFTLYSDSSFIHFIKTDSNAFFLIAE